MSLVSAYFSQEFIIRVLQEEQFARFSPSELIKLAFFSVLLEQTPCNPDKLVSRRFKLVKTFIEEITRVAPIESLYSAMAYSEDEEFVALCRQLMDALADSKIPPSLSMWHNSVLYLTRHDVPREYRLCALDVFEMMFVSLVQFGTVLNVWTAQYLFKAVFITVVGHEVKRSQASDDLFCEIIKNPRSLPAKLSNELFEHLFYLPAGFPSATISSVSLHYLFSKCSEFTPLKVLEEGRRELEQNLTRALFSLQKENGNLTAVASIICAFMQEHVRVPLVDNVASPWKLSKLHVQLLPAYIKYVMELMQLESDSYDEDRKLLFAKLFEQMANCIQQKLYEKSTLAVDSYVSRLQLLVTGVGNASCLSEQYKEYFLEAQLMHICQPLTITAATPTETIVSKWGKLFKRTTLSSVTKSFRPLVARWIRWSLMIHNLRHELAKHTAVGVVGLVNSGKSQLVNKLFQIKVCFSSCNNG